MANFTSCQSTGGLSEQKSEERNFEEKDEKPQQKNTNHYMSKKSCLELNGKLQADDTFNRDLILLFYRQSIKKEQPSWIKQGKETSYTLKDGDIQSINMV